MVSTSGLVVSDDLQASEWGAEILRRGGNAVDAAVATAFMLAVTRPYYGSLGGGGFLVFCPAPEKGPGKREKKPTCTTIDYRERAPRAATRDLFFREGKPRTDLSQVGALASGVPGVPAGLLTALHRFGRKSRSEVLRAPIEIAKRGFRIAGILEGTTQAHWQDFNSEAKRILGCRSSGSGLGPCAPGTVLKQPDLAKVLEEISSRGINGFYRGWVAQKMVDGLHEAGGILNREDLSSYQPAIREPLVGEFGGHEVVTMAPPSAGGAVLLQMLGYVERARKFGFFDEGYGSVNAMHVMAHAMALGFADRAKYFGDSDFVQVPVKELLSDHYLNERWSTFNAARAEIPVGAGALQGEGNHTTHFSVIDRNGNAVAVTTTINEEFGSGFVPPGTGVFMNDEMDDFSIRPGVPNLFGLVGAEANAIGPGKRPLSSMTPTIVRDSKDGSVELVIGGAGGPRITTAVFNVLVNRFVFGMSISDAMAVPRLHEQWKPSGLRVEKVGFSPDTLAHLQKIGYSIEEVTSLAKLHALERFANGRSWGAADPRSDGASVAE